MPCEDPFYRKKLDIWEKHHGPKYEDMFCCSYNKTFVIKYVVRYLSTTIWVHPLVLCSILSARFSKMNTKKCLIIQYLCKNSNLQTGYKGRLFR